MTTPRPRHSAPKSKSTSSSSPIVRLDDESKSYLSRAAELRGISLSDYVRTVTVPRAKRELDAASEQTLAMTASEQLAFWNALAAPPALSESQKRLESIMRDEG